MARNIAYFKLFTVTFLVFTVFFIILAPEHKNAAISRLKIYNSASFLPAAGDRRILEAVDGWKRCFAGKLSKVRYDPKEEPSVVVTLGVGLDVKAEETLKTQLPSASTFYAADPIYKGNGELFEPIGPYFSFAVGKETGVASASVLKNSRYITQVTAHIDIISFFSKFVKKSFIDQFLMDNEGPEYDILPMMARGREFDEIGLVVCQCNVEVHSPNDDMRRQFLDIVNTIIDEGRYVFLGSHAAAGHHRLFFVNVEHPVCVEKYLSKLIK